MNLEQHEIIQVLRRRAEMNQGTLGAKAFNTSYESGRTKIKNIELGKQMPTQDDLAKLAQVLGVSPVDLMPEADVFLPSTKAQSNGVVVQQGTLDRFPQLGPYLDMLNKAVVLDDFELIEHIGEKIASILQIVVDHRDEQAVNR